MHPKALAHTHWCKIKRRLGMQNDQGKFVENYEIRGERVLKSN